MIRAIAVVFLMWSNVALAQPSGAQAEVLFHQGRELLVAGKVAEACNAFEASENLEPAVTTLLNLAGCREKLGQFATAWGLFLDAARRTRMASDAATQQLHDIAQARAQKLEPRVSKLTIHVPQQSQLDGLQIARGPDQVIAGLWNRSLPIDGGTYTLTARAPGAKPWSTQVTVAAESDAKIVEIPDLRSLLHGPDKRPEPLPSSVVATAVNRAPPPPRTSSKVVPLVIGGGALALLGTGVGIELWAESRYAAAKSEMTSQPRRESLYESAATKRHIAAAFAVSGLAASGMATWLYLRGREHGAMTSTSMHITPIAGGLALSGQFF